MVRADEPVAPASVSLTPKSAAPDEGKPQRLAQEAALLPISAAVAPPPPVAPAAAKAVPAAGDGAASSPITEAKIEAAARAAAVDAGAPKSTLEKKAQEEEGKAQDFWIINFRMKKKAHQKAAEAWSKAAGEYSQAGQQHDATMAWNKAAENFKKAGEKAVAKLAYINAELEYNKTNEGKTALETAKTALETAKTVLDNRIFNEIQTTQYMKFWDYWGSGLPINNSWTGWARLAWHFFGALSSIVRLPLALLYNLFIAVTSNNTSQNQTTLAIKPDDLDNWMNMTIKQITATKGLHLRTKDNILKELNSLKDQIDSQKSSNTAKFVIGDNSHYVEKSTVINSITKINEMIDDLLLTAEAEAAAGDGAAAPGLPPLIQKELIEKGGYTELFGDLKDKDPLEEGVIPFYNNKKAFAGFLNISDKHFFELDGTTYKSIENYAQSLRFDITKNHTIDLSKFKQEINSISTERNKDKKYIQQVLNNVENRLNKLKEDSGSVTITGYELANFIKTYDRPGQIQMIVSALNSAGAKEIYDWHNQKVDIFIRATKAKFKDSRNRELKDLLMATKDLKTSSGAEVRLVEHTTVEAIWGDGGHASKRGIKADITPDQTGNLAGRILEYVRDNILSESSKSTVIDGAEAPAAADAADAEAAADAAAEAEGEGAG